MLNIDGIKYCIRLEITETPTEEFYFQWGVFLSRSSKKFVTLGLVMMLIFPWLQVCVKSQLSGYNFKFSGPSGNSLRRQYDVRVHPSLRDRLVPRSAGGNHRGHRLCQCLFLCPQKCKFRRMFYFSW